LSQDFQPGCVTSDWVTILFDSNAATNANVQFARLQLVVELHNRICACHSVGLGFGDVWGDYKSPNAE